MDQVMRDEPGKIGFTVSRRMDGQLHDQPVAELTLVEVFVPYFDGKKMVLDE